jgi:hypothetical protein
LERIAIAERLGKEIGLAVIPGGDVVSIDFDTKHYGSVQNLEEDWMNLVDRYPVLADTRMERTPSGGVHIYVRVTDRMVSWQRPGGGLHCNFTTEQGGPHRGEVLAGTRVSVCAPTRNGKGPYELINPEAAYRFMEVPDLASIGIFACVAGAIIIEQDVQPLPLCMPTQAFLENALLPLLLAEPHHDALRFHGRKALGEKTRGAPADLGQPCIVCFCKHAVQRVRPKFEPCYLRAQFLVLISNIDQSLVEHYAGDSRQSIQNAIHAISILP